ncbi:HAD-IIIC family phosphatase [Hydrogenophilus hirschii]
MLPWLDVEGATIRIAAAGDCLLTDVRAFLRPIAAKSGVAVEMGCLYLSAAGDGSFLPDEFIRFAQTQAADLLAVSLFTYDGLPIYRLLRAGERALLPQALDQARRFLLQLRERDDRTLLLHGVSGLPLSRRLAWLPVERWAMPKRFRDLAAALSEGLREIAAQLPHVWFVDEIVVAQRLGYRVANRPIVTGRPFVEALFHRRRFGFGLAETYLEVVRAYDRLRGVKVIAVDFDNTLWDGVMAEGPVRHYRDRQALLKRLQEGGILLVAVSKNDPQAIRWNEMVLQPEDFAVLAIGWELKPTTLAEIAAQLNLGLDAFVFLDDNPTERGLVASHLPQVRVWDACDPEPWRTLAILPALPWYSLTEEARQRTAMYRVQALRQQAVRAYGDQGSDTAVLAALQLVMQVHRMQEKELVRVHELTNRANQFNTTTIRYRSEELTDPGRQVWVGYLQDRFGDYGLVLVWLRVVETAADDEA